MADFDDIWSEYHEDGIGPRFWGVLLDVVALVVRSYPPARYGAGSAWDSDAIDDLAQSTAANQLLERAQHDYVMATAHGHGEPDRLSALKGLLRVQVTRELRRRYRKSQRTFIDVEFDAMAKLLRTDDRFQRGNRSDAFRPAGAPSSEPREPTQADLRTAVEHLRVVPRSPTLRAIYGTEERILVLRAVLTALPDVAPAELRKVLDEALTPWLPDAIEEDVANATSSLPEQESSPQSRAAVDKVLQDLGEEGCALLRLHFEGVIDGLIGERMGLKRTTVVMRRKRINAYLRSALLPLHPAERSWAMAELRRKLAEEQFGD